MTETNKIGGRVLYDADCAFCVALARRFRVLLARRGFEVAPLPEPGEEMRLVTRDGAERGGADAVVYLAGRVWWAFPVRLIAWLPGGLPLLRRGYRWIAARRSCAGGACRAGLGR